MFLGLGSLGRRIDSRIRRGDGETHGGEGRVEGAQKYKLLWTGDFERHRFSSMKLTLFSGVACLLLAPTASRAETGPAADGSENRPFVAIWKDHDGYKHSESPYLRVAIWNDGRIVFAKDTETWSHELLQGRIELARLAELKNALAGTGVFELKGYCYLVPDAAVDCVMLDIGAKQQMLYWDEVENANYGINISPKGRHLKFKACWKEVNRLALAAIPKQSEPYGERFLRPPKSWRLKDPVQSE